MTSRACEHHVSWADIVETSARVQHGTIWASSCRPHVGINFMWILRPVSQARDKNYERHLHASDDFQPLLVFMLLT